MHHLLELNDIEKRQKKTGTFIEDMPAEAYDKKKQQKTLNDSFFQNKDIYVSRHNRFAPYPMHTHTFLEINYLLQGQIDENINGKKIHLTQGDLILLDVGTSHSLGTLAEDGILINISFMDKNISLNFLKNLKGSNNILYQFLLNRSLDRDASQDYLIFRTEHNQKIRQILDEIIAEYYNQADFSDIVIKSYLNILITQLIRNYQVQAPQAENSKQDLAYELLEDIAAEYATISLQDLADRYAYNRNYLSNVFKEEIGLTFSEALNQQRIMQAHNLLLSSDLPISTIIDRVGISNKSFFYKKYFEQYHMTPKESRKANQTTIW